VIVQNLTLTPDPSEDMPSNPQYGFVLIKSDQAVSPNLEGGRTACMSVDPISFFKIDLMTIGLDPNRGKVVVKCKGDNKMPSINSLPHGSRKISDLTHGSYIHTYNKRATMLTDKSKPMPVLVSNVTSMQDSNELFAPPEMRKNPIDFKLHKCPNTEDLPLTIATDENGRRVYSFNFTMLIKHEAEEGLYYLVFHNCKGRRVPAQVSITSFNLSMLIYETNYPENYLSAGTMTMPQMYLVLSVMYFLIGCIWVNFISRQRDNSLKIHYLMTVLVFAKASSLLFHGINYHNIALYGQPVVTWAYLYYATRSLKGALFFITLALIGSGWSFIKHILSEKDKKIILVVVGLQVVAHVAEIFSDESTEGEVANQIWAEVCSMVDLFSCVAILFPISWSIKHLEEASRIDGKAAINLKKLELFKRFYIISTIYIYLTRIATFLFLAMLSYRHSWLAELVYELATLIYFIITGYYFQPQPTNPYLLLSSDTDLDEDILFSLDAHEMSTVPADGTTETDQADQEALLDEDGKQRKKTRRLVENIV